jgi:hypothetical protein
MECSQCGIRKNGGGKVREGDEQRVEYQRFEAFDEPDMQKKLKRSPFAEEIKKKSLRCAAKKSLRCAA